MVPEEITNYVREARAAGESSDAIRQSLKGSGWSPDLINQVVPSTSERSVWLLFVNMGALVILVLSAVVIYLWLQ